MEVATAAAAKSHLRLALLCTLTSMEVQRDDSVDDATIADSDEENRSFRSEDDQNIAERRWQSYCAAGDRHESRKRFEI
jgi:hypothetical protein